MFLTMIFAPLCFVVPPSGGWLQMKRSRINAELRNMILLRIALHEQRGFPQSPSSSMHQCRFQFIRFHRQSQLDIRKRTASEENLFCEFLSQRQAQKRATDFH